MANVRLDTRPSSPVPIDPESIVWVEEESTPGSGEYLSYKAAHKEFIVPSFTLRADTYTAVHGDKILPDNSSGALTIDLPASPIANTVVTFRQVEGQPFEDNSLTVGRNSSTIMGLSEDMVVETSDIQFEMRYDGTTWVVTQLSQVGTTF